MSIPRFSVAVAAAVLAVASTAAPCAPRVPSDDSQVLERLATRPGDSFVREAEAARRLLARDPRNLELALRLAHMHMARARAESDPRELGRAQAILSPWWDQSEPPVAVLVLRGTIRQTNHQFDLARADLEQVVRREPRNAQAWLTLATVQQVTDDLDSARASCARLADITPMLIRATCAAAIDGVEGNARAAFASLAATLERSPDAPAGIRVWSVTLQAELAQRLARSAEAERLYRDALALEPRDAYATAAYADFLLDEGRPTEVMRLIAADTTADPLLLRYALAARAARAGDGAAALQRLAGRFAASRARGDRVHLREEAIFALRAGDDPEGALALARENWKTQKEPLDARIALEAALAAGDAASVRDVVAWVARTGLEDQRIARLAALLGPR